MESGRSSKEDREEDREEEREEESESCVWLSLLGRVCWLEGAGGWWSVEDPSVEREEDCWLMRSRLLVMAEAESEDRIEEETDEETDEETEEEVWGKEGGWDCP